MDGTLNFVLNGRCVIVQNCSPNTTLLEYLRGVGLTGSKEGCAEGDCGACAVVIVDRDAQGRPAYHAINSCLVPLCLMAGREIISVEGVADGRLLHPVQRGMVESHSSQCGYCTCGVIASLFEGYYRDDLQRADELDDQLCGNLCRCTGYRPIRAAAIEAFSECQPKRGADGFVERLKKDGVSLDEVDYQFGNEKFFRPASLARLLQLFQGFPDGRLVAGATELGLDIAKRFKRFSTLISAEAVPELWEIKATDSEWRIGAAVTLTQIEETLADEYPALARMLRVFGSRLIRNRATMGGNLVTASPIGDSAPVLLTLDAKVVLASSVGERKLPIEQFFVAYRKTALQPGETLKTIILPRGISAPGLRRRCEWYKVSKRRELDISTVAACFTVDLDPQNVVRHARLAYGGVAAMPSRARKTESALIGKVWSAETLQDVLPLLRSEFSPISDVRGSAEYRRALVAGLLEKFFHSSEGRVTRVPDSSEKCFRLAGFVHPKHAHRSPPHESAHKHVTGQAIYTDDRTPAPGLLEVWPVCSPHARARIVKRDAAAARRMAGVKAVLLAEDVPGANDVGAVKRNEILLADKEVFFYGQIIALVVGESQEACRAAADRVIVNYEPLPPVLTLEQAIAAGNFHNEPNFIRRGDCDRGLNGAPMTMEGGVELSGQEHFSLETQAARAERGEDGSMSVISSTQHPSEVQAVIACVLNIPANKVVVQCARIGGGFGGNETQAATPAALAALAAHYTGQPVRVRWNRDQDTMLTGHRHPFLARFKIGFNEQRRLSAARIHLYANAGWSLDLSSAITDRALFHLDNA